MKLSKFNIRFLAVAIILVAVFLSIIYLERFSFFLMLGVTVSMSIIALMRLWFCRIKEVQPKKQITGVEEPMISIHMAICNEPPEIVLQTIKKALNLDYSNYHLVVLDNNTKDDKLWKPVEAFSKKYPEKIKFKHISKLPGFKAGALNECLKIMHPETEYIFTVDADYQLHSDSLNIALDEIQKNNTAVVQFPQNYVVNAGQFGIFKELEHFFTGYAQGGNRSNSTLPTGTLSMIRVESLKEISGWPMESLTEDAHLGIMLLEKKFSTAFSNKFLGEGIMPGSITDLRKQRYRWVYGNTQCFLKSFKLNLRSDCKLSVLMQLTAWINFLSIPIATTVVYLLISLFTSVEIGDWLPILIIIQFSVYTIGKLMLFLLNKNNSILANLRAFLIHLSLSFDMAFSPLMAIMGITAKFNRTNKFSSVSKIQSIPASIPFTLALLTSLLFLLEKPILAGCSLFLCILYIFSSLYLFIEFKPARQEATINVTSNENSNYST